MDRKKKLVLLITCGVVAVCLFAILLVGMLEGIWPWEYSTLGSDYKGMINSGNENVGNGGADATALDTTGATGSAGNQGSGSNGGASQTPGNNTDTTESKGPSIGYEEEPTELPSGAVIDFQDLLDKLNGNG